MKLSVGVAMIMLKSRTDGEVLGWLFSSVLGGRLMSSGDVESNPSPTGKDDTMRQKGLGTVNVTSKCSKDHVDKYI